MDNIAKELNAVLETSVVGSLLSPLGKRLYFPSGIVAQSQEATKASTVINATAGVALQDSHYITHSLFEKCSGLMTLDEMVSYAPTAGLSPLRQEWNRHIERENPLLKEKKQVENQLKTWIGAKDQLQFLMLEKKLNNSIDAQEIPYWRLKIQMKS